MGTHCEEPKKKRGDCFGHLSVSDSESKQVVVRSIEATNARCSREPGAL